MSPFETTLICILIADFITGLIHWIEDTYGVPMWPLIGKAVIEPNIDHHRNPAAFTMGDWIHRNDQSILGGLFVFGLVWCFGWACWPVVLVIVLAALGNEVHTWAHRKNNGPVVRFLQDAGLVQSKAQHAKHHKPPYNTYFCTLTNVLNPVLEAVCFWKSLEWLLSLVGVKRQRMSQARDGF